MGAALGLGLVACGGSGPADFGDPTGDVSDAASGHSETEATSRATTTAAATTTGDGVVSTGSTGDTDGPSGVVPACPPKVESSFDIRIEPGFNLVSPEGDFTWECEVLDKILFVAGATLMLDCTDAGVPVEPPPQLILNTWPAAPSLAVDVGDKLRVRYAWELNTWTDADALRVDAADHTLLIAGRSGASAADHSGTSAFDPFADVEMTALESFCKPEDDGCGVYQHQRLALTLDDARGEVQSREHIEVGTYGVWAPIIVSEIGMLCPIMGARFQLLLVRQVP